MTLPGPPSSCDYDAYVRRIVTVLPIARSALLRRTHTGRSTKVVESHEVSLGPHHLRRQCPAPVARHRHVRVDPRYPKSQPAYAGNPLIAEPVHIDRIEVRLAGDEHDPGIRDRPLKRPNAIVDQFLRSATER